MAKEQDVLQDIYGYLAPDSWYPISAFGSTYLASKAKSIDLADGNEDPQAKKAKLIELLLSDQDNNLKSNIIKQLAKVSKEKYEKALEDYLTAYECIRAYADEDPKIDITAYPEISEATLVVVPEDEKKEEPSAFSWLASAPTAEQKIQELITNIKSGSFTKSQVVEAFNLYHTKLHESDKDADSVWRTAAPSGPTDQERFKFLAMLLNPNDAHEDYKNKWDISTSLPTTAQHYSLFIKYFLMQSKAFYDASNKVEAGAENFNSILEQYAVARKIILKFAETITPDSTRSHFHSLIAGLLGNNLVTLADTIFNSSPRVRDDADMGLLLQTAIDKQHWYAAYQIFSSKNCSKTNRDFVLAKPEAKKELLKIAGENKDAAIQAALEAEIVSPVVMTTALPASSTTTAASVLSPVFSEHLIVNPIPSSSSSSSSALSKTPSEAIGLVLPPKPHHESHDSTEKTRVATNSAVDDSQKKDDSHDEGHHRKFGAGDPSPSTPTVNTSGEVTPSCSLCSSSTLLKVVGGLLFAAGVVILVASIAALIPSLGFSLPFASVGYGFIAAGLSLYAGTETLSYGYTQKFLTPKLLSVFSCSADKDVDASKPSGGLAFSSK